MGIIKVEGVNVGVRPLLSVPARGRASHESRQYCCWNCTHGQQRAHSRRNRSLARQQHARAELPCCVCVQRFYIKKQMQNEKGQTIYEERPIHHSNVMLYSNSGGVVSRVGKQCAPAVALSAVSSKGDAAVPLACSSSASQSRCTLPGMQLSSCANSRAT